MKERPILFSGEMVRSILEGRKTQTRRVVKLPPAPNHLGSWEPYIFDPEGLKDKYGNPCTIPKQVGIWHTHTGVNFLCPHGGPGDRLWVRETWARFFDNILIGKHFYRATDPDFSEAERKMGWRWRPSIFMPRWSSRITLEIVNIRVERLQDISKIDCIAEGMLDLEDIHAGWHQSYAALWNSINAKRGYGWGSNPWVWVIEFKKV